MNEQRFNSFSEFWPFYLAEHSSNRCRQLHFIGNLFAITGAALFIITLKWKFIVFAILAGYAWAWSGHFIYEKNRPATFRYPIFSLFADWVMFFLIITGKIGEHLTLFGIKTKP